MKGRIILHIGTPKTATSALQMFFVMNHEKLKEQGIYYPAFDKRSRDLSHHTNQSSGFNGNGTMLRFAFTKEYREFAYTSKKQFHHLVEATKKYPFVILSAEDFFDMGNAPFYQNFISAGCDVDVICYLRRQDQYYESLWGYFVKTYNDFNYTLTEFLESEEIHSKYCLDYAKRFSEIEQIIGSDHIIARSFDKLEGNIYKDFITSIGAEWSDDYKLPTGLVNEKLSLEMLEVKRRINELSLSNAAVLRDAVTNVQEKHTLTPRGSYLAPSERKDFLEQYKAGNESIEKKYRNQDKLFKEPSGEPAFKPDNSLIDQLYLETLEQIGVLQKASIGIQSAPAGTSALSDKIKRTLHKYGVLLHLTEEKHANQFVRHLNRKKQGNF